MLTNLMKKKREGFTLIELMIVVAIIGILAAIAIPAFINYVKRSKTTEASVQIKAMYQGAATYYQGEMAGRAVVMVGTVAQVTRCTVLGGTPTTNIVASMGSQKTVLDWTAQDPAFAAIGFNPADPIYYQYLIAGGDGMCADMTTAPASLYTFRATGDLDDDGVLSTFEINSSVNMEGNLYSSGGIFIANELE